jgi:hypothetical protein
MQTSAGRSVRPAEPGRAIKARLSIVLIGITYHGPGNLYWTARGGHRMLDLGRAAGRPAV